MLMPIRLPTTAQLKPVIHRVHCVTIHGAKICWHNKLTHKTVIMGIAFLIFCILDRIWQHHILDTGTELVIGVAFDNVISIAEHFVFGAAGNAGTVVADVSEIADDF